MHSGMSGGVARVYTCMRGVDPVIDLQTSDSIVILRTVIVTCT